MTITVQLEPDLIEKLQSIALERGQSLEELIVALLTRSTDHLTDRSATRPALPDWIGCATSGIPDLGVNVDEYLFKTLTRTENNT